MKLLAYICNVKFFKKQEGMKARAKIDVVLRSKKIRNAEWWLAILVNGKFGVYMNGKLQRLFANDMQQDAVTFYQMKSKDF